MRKSRALALVTVACSSMLIASPTRAQVPMEPQPDRTSTVAFPRETSPAEAERQELVDAVVDAVLRVPDTSGFAGSAVDSDALHVTLLWTAPVPDFVESLAGVTETGVTVTILPADYSEREVLAAAERVFAAARAGDVPVPNVAAGSTFSRGLTLEMTPTDIAKSRDLELVAKYSKIAGMPVDLVEGDTGPPQPLARQDDSDPWYGGGMIVDPNGHNQGNQFCSNAFAVVTSSGYGRLLSAAHCANAHPDRAWDDGARDTLTTGGTNVDRSGDYDSMLIDPVGGTDGWVHGGPWNAGSGHSRYHLKVGGKSSTSIGDNVCTSGANSGEHCGNDTDDGNISPASALRTWGGCNGTCTGYRAIGPAGEGAIVVGGDSGGPVYSNRSDGRVTARGVIYGGDIDANCGDVRWAVGNCFRRVYFIPILDVLNRWNVSLETTD